jgi:anti-sigma regulatory factor (Ser/Thr protein kinase)
MRVCSQETNRQESCPMAGTTTLELPRGAGSASIARLIVTAHGAALPDERLKSARLLVSELVSNACNHGVGRIELCVDSDAEGVRASVYDEGHGTIASRDPRPTRGGRGLMFVDRLSDSWGVEDGSSRVWFTVSAHEAA